MKYYSLVRSYYNYCDIFRYILGHFSDKDLADYLAAEFTKLYASDMLSYSVETIEIDETTLEGWESVFEKLKKEAE